MTELSLTDLQNLAAETEDQTIVTEGGDFEYTPPPAGKTIGRMIEYIEMGKQAQRPYKGQAKPDADVVRVSFELLHPEKNIHEIEVDGNKKIITDIVSITLTKKLSDKAKFRKLFNAMTYGRPDIKHMAQMLNEGFIISIYHNTVKGQNGEKDKVYVNLDSDGVYGISAPYIEDVMTGVKTKINVPEAQRSLKLFLFDRPTKATWDSLFIDGTKEIKNAKGDKETVTKNWLQEKVMSAKNYKGSALDTMLSGLDGLNLTETAAPAGAGTAIAVPQATQDAVKTPEAAPVAQAAPAVSSGAQSALAALGLS